VNVDELEGSQLIRQAKRFLHHILPERFIGSRATRSATRPG
jgi:hypothetical protein